jgi:hypothetical protein
VSSKAQNSQLTRMRASLLFVAAGAAQAFIPGQAPCGTSPRKLAGAVGAVSRAHRLHARPLRRPPLRMADESSDKEMEELLKKRVELLKEKEALLQERKNIASQAKESEAPIPEVQRPNMAANGAPAKRAEDLINAANGNIFQGGGNKKDGDTARKGSQPQSDETGFFGRRGFLRTLLVTFGFSALTLLSAFVLSYPRLEKLAYVQFGALFENGSITLRKQLYQAIENEDWKTVLELTGEDGQLEQQLIQVCV